MAVSCPPFDIEYSLAFRKCKNSILSHDSYVTNKKFLRLSTTDSSIMMDHEISYENIDKDSSYYAFYKI